MLIERLRTIREPLQAAALGDFTTRLSEEAQVITPEDDRYEAARRVWNGMHDRYPQLIVRPTTAQDVAYAIGFARSNSLPIAVRGGGHNVAGYGTWDGALVIDLSLMRTVEVDPVGRIARAGAGCLLGDLDRATQAHGLAVPTGMISATGLAGLTLGGGMGWLSRKHGLTSDNLLAVDVVTAEGELVRASTAEHPDLFWAVRGGGGNFGVVTTFTFRLHPVGPMVLGGMLLYPIDQAVTVLRGFRDIMDTAPDELTAAVAVLTAPPVAPFPAALHGQPAIAIVLCYAGDLERGQDVVRPLREIGDPLLDLVGPMPYLALQTMQDEGAPDGLHYWEKSAFLRELSDEAIDAYVAAVRQPTSPLSQVALVRLGGAIRRLPDDATAYAQRDAAYIFFPIGAWAPDDPDPQRHIGWVRGVVDALAPVKTGGVYVNAAEASAIVDAAYRPATLARLARIKAQYDPDNLFHLNQNIAPAAS